MGAAERRERERQARKTSVLRAACQLLVGKGLRRTTTKEIAECCELSEASLFFYFKNKDEILVSLLFECIDSWSEGLERIERLKLAPANALDEIWRFHEHIYEEHPEYYVISAYLAQSEVLEGISKEVKEEIVIRSGENFQRLANLLEQITDRAKGRILADMIWSTFLGLTILRASRINLGHADAHTGPQNRAAIFEILKSGLLQGARDNRDSI